MSPARETMVMQETPASSGSALRPERSIEAVLLGANDDTRLLLRGLLRLHRHRIVLEAKSVDDLRQLPPADGPRVLLQDVDDDDERWSEDLAGALRDHPELRAVVLLPSDGGGLRAEAMRSGARGVIVRPFSIRDLVHQVDDAAFGPEPLAPTNR